MPPRHKVLVVRNVSFLRNTSHWQDEASGALTTPSSAFCHCLGPVQQGRGLHTGICGELWFLPLHSWSQPSPSHQVQLRFSPRWRLPQSTPPFQSLPPFMAPTTANETIRDKRHGRPACWTVKYPPEKQLPSTDSWDLSPGPGFEAQLCGLGSGGSMVKSGLVGFGGGQGTVTSWLSL